jgi:hypothetical protein
MLSLKGRYLAAVFACGDGAALSHRSAAALHGLRASSRAGIDVIVPGRTARRHDGIDLHRAVHLEPQDITTVDAIPVTTVARTALDLAAVVRRRAVERALDRPRSSSSSISKPSPTSWSATPTIPAPERSQRSWRPTSPA